MSQPHRRNSVLARSIAALLIAPTPAQAPTAPPTEAGARAAGATAIWFLRDDAVWTCDGNGAAARRWSPAGMRIPTPLAPAPDGHAIAFSVPTLQVLDERGALRDLGRLDGHGARPVWSADGHALALGTIGQAVGDGGISLCTDVVAGIHAERLTAADRHEANPSFSPDGSLLAFAATLSQTVEESHDVLYVQRKSRVEVLELASGKRTIACERTGEIFELAWSPDGANIAFEMDRDLCIVPMARTTPGPLRVLAGNVRPGVPFAWSRDGSTVLASRNERPERYGQDAAPAEDALLVVPLRGDLRQVSLHATVYDADLAPDGTAIAVTTGERQLVRVDPATGERSVLVTGVDHGSPVWWRAAVAAVERR